MIFFLAALFVIVIGWLIVRVVRRSHTGAHESDARAPCLKAITDTLGSIWPRP